MGLNVISSQSEQHNEHTSPAYGKILKSVSVIGGAQVINLLLGMLRVKFAAVLIGPLGVGLLGNFQAIQGLVATLAGFGIQSSAVRDVAEAISQNNPEQVGKTILALRRFCWVSGLLGAAMIAGFSPLLSQWSFGSRVYASQIAWLALVILLGNLTGGQMAMIQGMRRIGDLARIQILGAMASTFITIVAYSCLGIKGIIPALLLTAIAQYCIALQFERQIVVPLSKETWRKSLSEAGGMARLGFVLMWSGLVGSVVLYLTRALITRDLGVASVGIFGAAYSLSGMLMNFILNAMGADYYPRLTLLAHDHRAMARLVNEQTEVGLLLAVPSLLATLVLAPWLIQLFYSVEFRPAIILLQWFVLGCLGRVISWPLGFVMLSLKRSRLFFIVETLLNALYLLLIWIGFRLASLDGVAMAFLGLNIFSIAVVYALCQRLIGFKWSRGAMKLLLILLPVIAIGFVGTRMLPIWPATVYGLIITAASGFCCLRELILLIGTEHRFVRQVLQIPGLRWWCRQKTG